MSSVSHAAFHQLGKNKASVNDSFDVLAEYAKTKPHGFAKAVYVIGVDLPRDLLGLISEDNRVASVVRDHLSLFKLTASPAALVDSVNTTVRSAWSYKAGKPIANGKEEASVKPLSRVVRDGMGIVNPINEIATFFTRAILFIPKESCRLLKGVNGIATASLMACSISESIAELSARHIDVIPTEDGKAVIDRDQETTQMAMGLVKSVSLLAMGALTALSTFTSLQVNALIFTALSVTSTVFTLLPFYHKNIGREKKII